MGDVHGERLANELARAEEHVKQLEKLNATLAAEVDRQRGVVEAARNWFNGAANWSEALAGAVATYEAAKGEG